MAHLWSDFGQLRATKAAGMVSQQITWAEIGAYDRETGAGLSIWEKRLIRRLDDAYEAARPGNGSSKPKPTNVADMRATLRATIAARNARAAAKGGEPSPT